MFFCAGSASWPTGELGWSQKTIAVVNEVRALRVGVRNSYIKLIKIAF
jgi:hypothetical protein